MAADESAPGHAAAESGETIVAPASGHGRAGRAIIRVSGPAAHATVRDLMARSGEAVGAAGEIRRAELCIAGDTEGRRLPCLVIRYDGPASFTGEDSVEIVLPGNPALIDRVIALLMRRPNVRLAQPGEFAARAYLAGKLTIEQAEGIAAKIAAQTDSQLAAAERLLDGTRGRQLREWTGELATLLALVEAGIDFTDQEDVVAIGPGELVERTDRLCAGIARLLGGQASWERSGGLPRVALVGPPNAGKSTLFNALLGRQRSVVSDIAGTTRDAIAETLELSGDAPGAGEVQLLDLPGMDASMSGGIDRAAQARAAGEAARADVLIHCDATGAFREDVAARGVPVIRVRTKMDLGGEASGAIGVCALDGWNLGTLRRAIADAVQRGQEEDPEAATLPRHRRALAQSLDGLNAALAAAGDPAGRALSTPELVSAGLRAALDHLGEITGDVTPDDVLGRVFAVFCIGK